MAHGAEVECAVLGSPHSSRAAGAAPAIVSEPGEIVLAGEWYDFSAKYAPGGMQLTVPARISHGATEQVKKLALEAFLLAGCDGLARVDFFVDGERVLRQRAEHDARLHPHERVRQADGRRRRPLSGARRPSLPPGARAPRTSGARYLY